MSLKQNVGNNNTELNTAAQIITTVRETAVLFKGGNGSQDFTWIVMINHELHVFLIFVHEVTNININVHANMNTYYSIVATVE